MQRQIKFRAWVKASEKLGYVMMQDKDLSLVFKLNNKGGFEKYYAVDYKLMQYTGLKDKNGVEVYEGDIVRMPADLWIGKESVGVAKGTYRDDVVVESVEGSFRLNKLGDESKNYYGVINYSTNNQADKFEVIGNIYESPELLK